MSEAKKSRPSFDEFPPALTEKTGWPWTFENKVFSDQVCDDEKELPKISIITPSFNQAQYLEETIRSVLLQGYRNLEYIVIDGGSTDGSIEIIKKYEPWISYWVSERDRGQAHAINKGFTLASGEWLGWINSDDYYLPGAFLNLYNAIQKYKNRLWFVGQLVLVSSDGREIRRIPSTYQSGFWRDPSFHVGSWLDFVCVRKSGTFLPQQTSFWAKSICDEAGKLDEIMRCAFDFEYYVRLGRTGAFPVCLEQPTASFRIYEQQISANELLCRNDELNIALRWLSVASESERKVLKKYISWLRKEIYLMKTKKFLDFRKKH